MKENGFTLFTALVAFVLIALTILLVESMINSERSTTDLIASIDEQEQLQTIADSQRADALQQFNFITRQSIEKWFLEENNKYLMEPDKTDWETLKNEFIAFNFGGKSAGGGLSRQVAYSIVGAFTTGTFKGYEITIKNKDRDSLETIIQKIYDKGIDNKNLIQIIDCGKPENPPENPNQCNGAFYINLDATLLNESEYEQLPSIQVKSLATGTIIQEPILPRARIQIYVPIRIFKALALARKIACNSTNCYGLNDNGLFSAKIHNELEELRLGYCDARVCAPRTSPYELPAENSRKGLHCKQGEINLICTPTMQEAKMCNELGPMTNSYLATNPEEGLPSIAKKRVCSIIEQNIAKLELTEDFGIIRNCETETTATAETIKSKIHKEEFQKKIKEPISLQNPPISLQDCPMQLPVQFLAGIGNTRGGIGLYLEDDKLQSDSGLTEKSLPQELKNENSENSLTCAEINKIGAIIVFEEKNKSYMVDKTIPKHFYKINLQDNRYKTFLPNYFSPINQQTCALERKPSDAAFPFNSADWTCASTIELAAPEGDSTKGCGFVG